MPEGGGDGDDELPFIEYDLWLKYETKKIGKI
jgi:hypothetical protein